MYQCDPLTQLIQQIGVVEATPIQQVETNWTKKAGISLLIKRDDLIHPVISGNKWRKLKYQLAHLVNQKSRHVISFGGGYSNHLHALAFCCHHLNITCRCIIRGRYPTPTPMLNDIRNWNANIDYVTKDEYLKRHDESYLNALRERFSGVVLIPEGGSNYFGMDGIKDLAEQIPHDVDVVVLPVGSGGTTAGLIRALPSHQSVLGVAVLKGEGYLEELVKQFLFKEQYSRLNWSINHHAHCGGYAKKNDELIKLCEEFEQDTHVPIEPVYTGKCVLGIKQLCERGYFQTGSRVLMVHTGGLQGKRALG